MMFSTHSEVLQMSLVLGIAFISLSFAKPCSFTANPTTKARVARKPCLTGRASVVFLLEVFIALSEFHPSLLVLSLPVFMLLDLVAYECHSVSIVGSQSHR